MVSVDDYWSKDDNQGDGEQLYFQPNDTVRQQVRVGEMYFESSWNWLMPVQKKIAEIYSEDAQLLHFEHGDLFDELEVSLFNADIETAYNIMVQIIKILNK